MKIYPVIGLCFILLFLSSGCKVKDSVVAQDNYTMDKVDVLERNKKGSNLDAFINEACNGIPYKAKFSFEEGYETKDVTLKLTKVSDFEKGVIYELSLDGIDKTLYERFPIFLYIQEDRIYRFWNFLEGISTMENEADIIKNSVVIYQNKVINDNLEKEEQGIHHFVSVDENRIESHYFQLNEYANVIGYFETFIWEDDNGLKLYRSGFGADADLLELEKNNILTTTLLESALRINKK